MRCNDFMMPMKGAKSMSLNYEIHLNSLCYRMPLHLCIKILQRIAVALIESYKKKLQKILTSYKFSKCVKIILERGLGSMVKLLPTERSL